MDHSHPDPWELQYRQEPKEKKKKRRQRNRRKTNADAIIQQLRRVQKRRHLTY